MSSLYTPFRAAMFALPAETAHDLTLRLSAMPGAARLIRLTAGAPVDDPVTLMGLRFANRVGLAAGLDKNAAHLDALAAAGFGFLEAGTVTPLPQPGNPKPRMFRLPARQAIINRFGFNNDGLDTFARNVQQTRYNGVLGLNIGKNAVTPNDKAIDDYRAGLRRCHALASYITVNVSSPNTSNLRALQHDKALGDMLAALVDERAACRSGNGRHVPILLKIAPDLTPDQIEQIAGQLVEHGFDGVIATNTTIARAAVEGAAHAGEAGGLSGAPLQDASTRVIAALRACLPDGFPIIGVGGILSAGDALAKLRAGANLLQVYSGLVYRGPALVRECALAAARHFAAPGTT